MYQVDDFLAHYGVKGMRWGVIRKDKAAKADKGPVSADIQARRNKKAEKFELRAGMAQTRIAELQISNRTANTWTRANNNSQIKSLTKERDRALKDAELKREGKLSTAQRKAVIGASIAAGIIVTSAAIKAVDSGDIHRAVIKGREAVSGEKHAWKRNEFLARKDFDIDDLKAAVVKDVNPDFGSFGANMNCRRSTFAYEMRRRGYDVSATKSAFATGQSAGGVYNALNPNDKKVSRNLLALYGRLGKDAIKGETGEGTIFDFLERGGGLGAKKVTGIAGSNTSANAKRIFDSLKDMPDGSRGEVSVMWAGMPAGHSIAWEVVKGKATLIDAQMNKIIADPDDFRRVYQNIGAAAITRLDNAELNPDFLLRWLKNA